jgi:hypothetical protein
MKLPSTLAALLIACVPAAQAQAAPPCMTPAEAQALIVSFMPDIIKGLRDVCKASLPADAFLTRSGEALAERYEPEARTAWTSGRAAAVKISGGEDVFKRLDDETARKAFGAGIANEIAKDMKTKDCAMVDGVARALEPLPPANMSMLIGSIMEAVAADPKMRRGKLPICAPVPVRR